RLLISVGLADSRSVLRCHVRSGLRLLRALRRGRPAGFLGLLRRGAPCFGPAGSGSAAGARTATTAALGATTALTALAPRRTNLRLLLLLLQTTDQLALVDPDLHTDPAEAGPRLEEAVV